jgi:hypothetical protein
MFAVRVPLVRAVRTEMLAQQVVWLAQRVGAIPVARLSQLVAAELRVPAVSPAEAPQRRGADSAQKQVPVAVALPAVQPAAPISRARLASQQPSLSAVSRAAARPQVACFAGAIRAMHAKFLPSPSKEPFGASSCS